MSDKPPKAKKIDTPSSQLMRAFAIINEHSEACVVMLYNQQGILIRHGGGKSRAEELIRIASHCNLPNANEGEFMAEFEKRNNDEGD